MNPDKRAAELKWQQESFDNHRIGSEKSDSQRIVHTDRDGEWIIMEENNE